MFSCRPMERWSAALCPSCWLWWMVWSSAHMSLSWQPQTGPTALMGPCVDLVSLFFSQLFLFFSLIDSWYFLCYHLSNYYPLISRMLSISRKLCVSCQCSTLLFRSIWQGSWYWNPWCHWSSWNSQNPHQKHETWWWRWSWAGVLIF